MSNVDVVLGSDYGVPKVFLLFSPFSPGSRTFLSPLLLLIHWRLTEERSVMNCKPMSASLRWFRLSYEGSRSGDTMTDCSAQEQDRMIVCTYMNTPSQSVIL